MVASLQLSLINSRVELCGKESFKFATQHAIRPSAPGLS